MKTALVIEDNYKIRENTIEILELVGFRVISAISGKEGVKSASSMNPDVILCDIMMAEMSGYAVLKELKKIPATAGIPFIYVMASAEKNEMKMALDMGADGYVRKPFDIRELIEVIDNAIKK